eukprot:CAMPEP_0172558510 /NCGR_PEP_ID=MMETSP1067-20121228/79453_1 /TAXON_ID=265564 ORGANISM="Thalassiosira punctigera, Strain Tpunct2005C2" /NCGR_SAMPLE_ID=MMETSP1067 /ASSEMBLY_ACC=CAM_ASM_000444 /LENGTH=531 /DNA_ID=CAMNT_0013347887 /DNA_START=72 /DNA_END=1667 /DNA_ORIENTATION=-
MSFGSAAMIAQLGWFLAALGAALLSRYLRWRFSHLNKIPGPIKEFTFREWVVGVFTVIEKEPFMQPQQRWWKEAEREAGTQFDTRLLHYTGVFGKHFICVLDADGVKQILTSKASSNPRFVKGLYYLQKVIGAGLVTIDGSKWHRHRRIIQPSFNNQLLKEALSSCIPDMVHRLNDAWGKRTGSDIDIAKHFSAITLDIIGKVAFSHDFLSMDSVEQWANNENCEVELKDPLGLYSTLMPSVARMLLVNLRLSSLEKYVIPSAHKTHNNLNQAVESVVKEAHTRYQNRQDESTKPKCLLELLFDAKDTEPGSRNEPLSHKELEEETKTFLVAGHETTSTLCVWAIYCLIQHPHIQSLVLEDIMKYAPEEGQISLELLDKMTYFEAFLNEVLRLYPPVGMIVRNTSEWVNLLGEQIPPHTRVMIPIYLLHRHPKYWTEPECFKPERWLNSTTGREGGDGKYHHFAYLPFSAGGRNCIGQRFAMWEAKLILAPIIRKFEMTMSPAMDGVELKLVSFITMKSVPPVLIRAQPRF